jgi:uncharacterized cupin superfamily protein
MAESDFYLFDQIQWEVPKGEEGSPVATRQNVRRKLLSWGNANFWVQHVNMQPGHRVDPHSHSIDELIVILEGGCQIDGGPALSKNDSAVLRANLEYGFTVGPEGMSFLIVRTGQAKFQVASS